MLPGAHFSADLRSAIHFWIAAVAEEKNTKNSPGAGDENCKNRFIGVNWVGESENEIRFCISAMVLEILLKYH